MRQCPFEMFADKTGRCQFCSLSCEGCAGIATNCTKCKGEDLSFFTLLKLSCIMQERHKSRNIAMIHHRVFAEVALYVYRLSHK